jgi:hypothetical protein
MIDLPDLPVFNVPENMKNCRPPDAVVSDWIDENIVFLKKSGQMERLRRQKSRQPADVQFKI